MVRTTTQVSYRRQYTAHPNGTLLAVSVALRATNKVSTPYPNDSTMAKFTVALLSTLLAGSSAFVSQQPAGASSALKATEGVWDPMGFLTLGEGEAFDTFPGMFPKEQFLREAEIKHGRQAMLAWTGVWATSKVRNIHHRLRAIRKNARTANHEIVRNVPATPRTHPISRSALLAFVASCHRTPLVWDCTSLVPLKVMTGPPLSPLSPRTNLPFSVPSLLSLLHAKVNPSDTLATTSVVSPPRLPVT